MNTPAETQVVSVPDGSIRDYVDGKFRKDTPVGLTQKCLT